MKRRCLSSLTILSIIILTIITLYNYRNDRQYRHEQLKKLISSIPSITHVVNSKPFPSNVLPRYLTKFIEDYLSTEHDSYLIIDCETGLGNRFQTIVSAFLMALLTNRRLLIHWPTTRLSNCRFDQLFESSISMSSSLLTHYTKEEILVNSYHLKFHGPFDELLCQKNFTSFKQEWKFLFLSTDEYFLSVLIKNPAYSQTLFFNVDEDILFKVLINYLVIPIKELNHRIDFHRKQIKQCDRGIHMRKDGLKRIKINGEKVFLDCILNQTTKENESEPSECLNVQQAVIELWLLSTCRQLFLTHWSSFSWLASGMSGTHPIIVTDKSCHVQPFSRPCYYELTHVRQLSCYNYDEMLRNDSCCQSKKFCESECLHHDSKYGSHSLYFLIVWPLWSLFKWFAKWLMIFFIFIFFFNTIKFKWDYSSLISFYRNLLIMILFFFIIFVNIRCLYWFSNQIL